MSQGARSQTWWSQGTQLRFSELQVNLCQRAPRDIWVFIHPGPPLLGGTAPGSRWYLLVSTVPGRGAHQPLLLQSQPDLIA